VLIHRLADADAAASIAAHTGTRLAPAAALDAGQAGSASLPALPLVPAMASGAAIGSGAAGPAPWPSAVRGVTRLVPRPAVPARALLSLGPGQFVLLVNSPRRRLVELGQAVRARLPRRAAP